MLPMIGLGDHMLNPDEIRSKPDMFKVRLRGYDPEEVRTFMARSALVVEAVREGAYDMPELPDDFSPVSLRAMEFSEIWRGLDRKQVREFVQQLREDLEAIEPASPPT